MDNVEYDSCPYCFSKKVTTELSTKTKRVTVKCEECGCKIDSYPLKDKNE